MLKKIVSTFLSIVILTSPRDVKSVKRTMQRNSRIINSTSRFKGSKPVISLDNDAGSLTRG